MHYSGQKPGKAFRLNTYVQSFAEHDDDDDDDDDGE